MADEVDIEKLIVELQANAASLNKQLAKIASDVDKRLLDVERRTERFQKRVDTAFTQAGRAFNRLGASLLGGAAFIGISRFVSNISDAAGKIQDTSEALGLSTDLLQTLGVLSGRAGVRQQELNRALGQFTQKLGEAQTSGGKFADFLKSLDVDIEGSPEEVLFRIADAVKEAATQQERAAIVAETLGARYVRLTPIIQLGSKALKEQQLLFIRNGQIMTREAIAKIDELGDKWEDLKRRFTAIGGNVLAGFADEFSEFADQLSSPEFTEALQNFGNVLAQVVAIAVKLSAVLPNIVGGLIGLRIGANFGPIGALVGGVVGAIAPNVLLESAQTISQIQREIDKLKASLRGTNEPELFPLMIRRLEELEKRLGDLVEKRRKLQVSNLPLLDPLGPFSDQARTRARAEDDELSREAARILADRIQAEGQLAEAIAQANAESLQGTTAYYDAVRAQIEITTSTAIKSAEARKTAEIAALDRGKLRDKFAETVAEIERKSAAEIAAIRVKGGADQARIDAQEIADAEERADALRDLTESRIQAEEQVSVAIAKANAESLRGTLGYYDAAREASRLETDAAVAAANRKKEAEIDAVNDSKLSIEDRAARIIEIEARTRAEISAILQQGKQEIFKINNDEIDDAARKKDELIRLAQEQADAITDIRRNAAEAQRDLESAKLDTRQIEAEVGISGESQFDIARDRVDLELEAQKAAIEERLAAEIEAQTRLRDQRLSTLEDELQVAQEHADALVAIEEEAQTRRLEAEERAKQRRVQIAQDEQAEKLQFASDFFGSLATLSRSGNETLASIGKAAAIAEATINGIRAVQLALASPLGFPFNFALAAAVGIQAAANVARIASLEKGGIVGPDGVRMATGGVVGPDGLRQSDRMSRGRFQRGGVERRRQIVEFAEADKAEAFIPLPDGQRVPVILERRIGFTQAFVPLPGGRRIPVRLQLRGEDDEEWRRRMNVRSFAQGGVMGGRFGSFSSINDLSLPRELSLQAPNIVSSSETSAFAQNFMIDARGAQEGVAEQIAGQLRILGPQLAAATLRKVNRDLPDMMVRVGKAKL